jgi:hypothetical protein
MDARFEILDAFVDGEPVDPAELKDALADPDGRQYFVDAWALRNAVHEEMVADPAVYERRALPRFRNWIFAASAASVCLIGGYAVGSRVGPAGPVAPASDAADAVASPSAPFPAPAPTRVIRLELDPNWTERAGGR